MEHPRIDVAEHAVLQPHAIEQGAEFEDIVCQVFRRNRRVLDKRDRARLTRSVT